ncbi:MULTISPECIES: tRNA (N6-isopentenyl adenosine(37)-C2)-methylthiotransferase MiaB [Weeksella]|uniref:tRNA-2-methylthio-N(6)-dimethylallyladenosine synthase n=1 Tax=Weeksella virosa (strain ATCC 43766 / DSM 16922 / JCM 21250 / CCUG 30538 / CDC 9751 / IAM 14551 / NBRC 16016 / NCTC 11634 / CL345/78) TaxID=865938 RepID=F0NZL5_WEEVC|nr:MULTISPECIES: tRNA (N6-isopentenyl adenosine(37)-C2)-methylthiotransferase MiaB [Weeksella]ADX67274.1 (Dimethylallyl)adenosine tRNA methylthiotransferase miaB [Weeksella virosa DSM 16922]MDK7374496.1 tRNA (N6-isopentenyl adenosine(37)-C2)-methylthiotransferase MiaB [Weeksella virosa]MDK7675555.1 tRNA (N6-isopentenyl adenosine(37)-C2)-methylthiotransferase MiaB [Weeksella virosa]OFM81884.1 tRNA-2-methylthio-N(6)-dimethylallyladenosine synthase MiaB [Weeksella sp. HMSC059D05]SUP53555.1 (Dimet
MQANEKYIDESRQGEALMTLPTRNASKKLFLESYGCQMNFSDSEIVASILTEEGYQTTNQVNEADLILLNTCSIRDKAEQTVRNRLNALNAIKKQNPSLKIGVLGCMAERLKHKFLEEEHLVDIVVGPDAYRDLPNLLTEVEDGRDAINVQLSKEETYAEISPIRLGGNGVTAFVTITRGCDNMCTFCVVPFTRGRERSRDPHSILREIQELHEAGYKEVTLLGQNVDSYLWYGGGPKKDFKNATEIQKATAVDFAQLLDMVAMQFPSIRIRFSTSNPQDMKDNVLETMAKHHNICKYIHLPVQSGSTTVLERMNRQHTREQYFELIDKIRKIIPDCALSHDMIAGFCGETEEEHQDTLSLMEYVKYDFGYMFAYSDRPGTPAHKKMADDVPAETKKRRLQEIISLQQQHSAERMKAYVGKTHEVLIEGNSKKDENYWFGRNTQNAVIVFPKIEGTSVGDFVQVYVHDCTTATLLGEMQNQN